MKSPLLMTSLLLATLLPRGATGAEPNTHWHGVWNATGTPFTLRLIEDPETQEIRVEQIESLGFEWTATGVTRTENTLLVDIDYAGITGTVQVTRQSTGTALASPLSCTPEYMVVCVLSKGQQELFLREEE